MSMRVVIAEKPSLGRAIADALPGRFTPLQSGKNTYALKGEGVVVTWAYGHILEMAPPETYDPRYKRWRIEDLPIVPQNFVLQEKEPAQIKAIASLLRQAKEVVNAGDPDREGQLLIDEILEYLRWRGPTWRLLPHATDPESIRKAWAKLRPNDEFRPLYHAALCRQRADWLVGMNASRAATLLLTAQNQLVPLGRVMTPTLALVVRRDLEIEGFASRSFWKIKLEVKTQDGTLVTLWHDPAEHIFDRAQAQSIARACADRDVVLRVASEKKRERAPLPWHLGDYQRHMQKVAGLTLQQSLQVLQSLYEKQLVSYPRTDCRYLPEEQKADAIPVLRKVATAALGEDTSAIVLRDGMLAPKDYIYDNSKVAEHHGLVPTGKLPAQGASDIERTAWAAVVQHFARTLLPHHEYIETEMSTEAGGVVFAAKGKQSLNWDRSWRLFDEQENSALPAVPDGTPAKVLSATVEEGKTTPPQRYTEATLAADMEAIAKYVTDERIKAKLKETAGIGTAATRSAIIEKLKEKGMVQAIKKGKTSHLVSTPFGREVVSAVPKVLSDPGLTAAWEEALDQVARSQYDAQEFLRRAEHMVCRLIEQMKSANSRCICSMPSEGKSTPTPKSARTKPRSGGSKTSTRSRSGRKSVKE
jgi:DNA topoisomerase-3